MSPKPLLSPRARALLLFSLGLLLLQQLNHHRARQRPSIRQQSGTSTRIQRPKCVTAVTHSLLPAHPALPDSLRRYVRDHAAARRQLPTDAALLRRDTAAPPVLVWRCVSGCTAPLRVLRAARLAFLLASLSRRVLLLDVPAATLAALPPAAVDWRLSSRTRRALLGALYERRDGGIAKHVHLAARGKKKRGKRGKKTRTPKRLSLADKRLSAALRRLPRVVVVSFDRPDQLLDELARNPALPPDVRDAPRFPLARAVVQTLFRPGDEAVRRAAAMRPGGGVGYVGVERSTVLLDAAAGAKKGTPNGTVIGEGKGERVSSAGAACVRGVLQPARGALLVAGARADTADKLRVVLRDDSAEGPPGAAGRGEPMVVSMSYRDPQPQTQTRAEGQPPQTRAGAGTSGADQCARAAQAVADAVALGGGAALVARHAALSETAALLGSARRVVVADTDADGSPRCQELLRL